MSEPHSYSNNLEALSTKTHNYSDAGAKRNYRGVQYRRKVFAKKIWRYLALSAILGTFDDFASFGDMETEIKLFVQKNVGVLNDVIS